MVIYSLVISTINKVIQANQSSIERLKHYVNQSFTFNLAGVIRFSATINQNGLLEPVPDDIDIDTNITIPLVSMTNIKNGNSLKLLQQLTISGNRKFAVDLLTTLNQLSISGTLYNQLPPHYLPVVSIIVKLLDSVKNTLTLIYHNTQQTISEYLRYENPELLKNCCPKAHNHNPDLNRPID
jgi:ubiquinone biosynthesis protein UbiJ